MDTVRYNKYEDAVKHVKRIKGFYKHVITYVIINIIILIIKRKAIYFVVNNTTNIDQGFEDWMHINIWSTPVIWGIILIIHGLYVYRFKFSFFRNWEERKIKEFMNDDSDGHSNNKGWE